MDQERIDQLFRERLNSYEAVPSKEAWASVEKQIGRKSTPIFYWVAASISLLIAVSWILYPRTITPSDSTPIATSVDHPIPLKVKMYAWKLPETHEELMVGNQAVKAQSPASFVASNESKVSLRKEEIIEIEDTLPLELESITEVALADIELSSEKIVTQEVDKNLNTVTPIKIELSKVKITYIAAEESKQAVDSTGGIKKLFAKAGRISPGDVLADIKTAKDNLINNGFKSMERDRSSL